MNGTTRLERRDSVLYIVAEWEDAGEISPAGPRRLAIEVADDVRGGISADLLRRAGRYLDDMTAEVATAWRGRYKWRGPSRLAPSQATTVSPGESVLMIKTSKLVYGHATLHDCLAFADGETAADEAREIVAIATAATWGDARDVEVQYAWNPTEELDDAEDDEPFDINELGSVIEGDWPPMVTSRALRLLPKDLKERFGEIMDTVHNGDYLEVPLAAEAEIVAALRERGYEVTRDDELINTLDGGTFHK